MQTCRKCKIENKDEAVFCKECGARINEKPFSLIEIVSKIPMALGYDKTLGFNSCAICGSQKAELRCVYCKAPIANCCFDDEFNCCKKCAQMIRAEIP